MAKLKANGTELWRLERTKDTPAALSTEPKAYDCIQEIKRYAAMSNGHLLYQLICVWRDGQRHNYGWKQKTDRAGKLQKYTVEQFSEVKAKLEAIGFQE